MCDGLFVLVVRGPNCYFIPFGADINDSSTNVIAEVVKSFAHETQKLQEKQMSGPNILLLASSCISALPAAVQVSRCVVMKTAAR